MTAQKACTKIRMIFLPLVENIGVFFVCLFLKRVMKWVTRIEISLELGIIYEMDLQLFALWLCL